MATEQPMAKAVVAGDRWRARIRAARGNMGVWLLTPARELLQVYVRDLSCLPSLLYSESPEEQEAQRRHLLHPGDCDYRLLGGAAGRAVSVLWCPASVAAAHRPQKPGLNVTATRLLLEHGLIEPPPVHGDPALGAPIEHLDCCPEGPVVLFQTHDGKLVNYGPEQLRDDWTRAYFAPAALHCPATAYRRLAAERYRHHSQPLAEYEKTYCRTPFLCEVTARYVGMVGPSSHWDRAQMVVLGAALLLVYRREWDDASRMPRGRVMSL